MQVRSSRSIAVMVLLAALLGGAVAAGLVATFDHGKSTTTVIRETVRAGTTGTSGIDAVTVFETAASGVVDITARISPTSGEPGAPPQEQEATAAGAGFLVGEAGRIVTAAHVVDGASSITVTLQGGVSRKAMLLGSDDATDVAVLQLAQAGLTLHPLTLGSSAGLGIGDGVAAIGAPFDYSRSISTGIVSGLDRTIEAPNGFTVAHAIQTDAALNPGNSGGPLLDARGRVVGVVDQIATNGAKQSSGVGFAVPIDLVARELDALARGHKVEHAYLGVGTTDGDNGALVQMVTSGSPAAAAGLRAGDTITAAGATRVAGTSDLVAAVAARHPGERVTLTVRRGSGTLRLNVTLATQPS